MFSGGSRSSRRQVLRGAGGFTLAVPFLPSLLPRGAQAQTATPPRLFWMTTDHGGAFETNMFPRQSLLTDQADIFPDHRVRWGRLTGTTEGSNTVVSPVLTAPASRLTPRLLGKMNVLFGFDVSFYIAHNTGLHLGNYARNDGNSPDSGGVVRNMPRPTIDQLMAWSPKFYSDLTGVRERAMVMGSRSGVSWNWSTPSNRSGDIVSIAPFGSSRQLFSRIYTSGQGGTPVTMRSPIVDRVLANYRTLRNSNRRLSSLDKQRLEAHIDKVAELQRKLGPNGSGGGSGLGCPQANTPAADANQQTGNNPTAYTRENQLWNDVVSLAFACGTSRIGVLGLGNQERAVGYSGSWHQDIAHNWGNNSAQGMLVQAYRLVFADIFLDLAAKLDAVQDANGASLLDSTLMCWTQESCMATHETVSVPVVTFGSAGGKLKTGNFVDFRRVNNAQSAWRTDVAIPGGGGNFVMYQGLLYNQWLANVMLAMGLERPDFELWNHRGYGVPFVSPESWLPYYRNHYQNTSSRYYQMASDKLPFLWTS